MMTSLLSRTSIFRLGTHNKGSLNDKTTMIVLGTVSFLGACFIGGKDTFDNNSGEDDTRTHFCDHSATSVVPFWSKLIYSGLSAPSAVSSSFSLLPAPMITLNHCQVPCGIFDDPAMVDQMKQACTTIRKSIVESNTLHSDYVDATPLNTNQFIRWVMTKEKHADDIISTVSDYCLCQRVKRPAFNTEEEYLQALKVHHRVLQAAMKTKQSMSLEACDELEHAVSDLSKLYIK